MRASSLLGRREKKTPNPNPTSQKRPSDSEAVQRLVLDEGDRLIEEGFEEAP